VPEALVTAAGVVPLTATVSWRHSSSRRGRTYVRKPLDPRLFVARVEATIRRSSGCLPDTSIAR